MFWIYVVGGVVLLVVGFLAYLVVADQLKEKRVRERGRAVTATLMMANQSLYDPDGDPETPGFALFVFEPPSPAIRDELVALGERLHELYADDKVALTDETRTFGKSLQKHNYTESRRRLVPPSLTGGRTVYIADLWIKRDRLPPGWQDHRGLACMATGTDEGSIILLDAAEPEALEYYRRLDVE